VKAYPAVLKVLLGVAAIMLFGAVILCAVMWPSLVETYEACVSSESTLREQRGFLTTFLEQDYKQLNREELFQIFKRNYPGWNPTNIEAGIQLKTILVRFDALNNFNGIEFSDRAPFDYPAAGKTYLPE
jgi:hypothetical protein